MGRRWTFSCVLLLIAVAAANAAVPDRTVPVADAFNAGILHVERFGNGRTRPVIFIPALFCGSWQWNGQVAALAPAHEIYVVTLPGFDGRPAATGDDLMRRAADALHELVLSRKLERPVIVGHSLGAMLAVYFAERYPADESGVVAVDGGYPYGKTQAERNAAVEEFVKPYLNVSRAEFGPVLRKNELQYDIISKQDVDKVEMLAARSDPKAVVAWARAGLALDLTPGLHHIAGRFVEFIPYDRTIDRPQNVDSKRKKFGRWAAHARDGRVVMFAPSRHFIMFDQPDAFDSALKAAVAVDP